MLRCQVELGDAALVIDCHDAIECRVQDRRVAHLAVLQLIFRPLTFSNCPLQLFVKALDFVGGIVGLPFHVGAPSRAARSAQVASARFCWSEIRAAPSAGWPSTAFRPRSSPFFCILTEQLAVAAIAVSDLFDPGPRRLTYHVACSLQRK